MTYQIPIGAEYPGPCPYCQRPLIIDGRWSECNKCRVSFAQWDDTPGLHIKWEREIYLDNGYYWVIALNLYPEANRTILTAFHSNYIASDNPSDDLGHTEIKLDHCMTNITPDNCLDKIKFLLVWQ